MFRTFFLQRPSTTLQSPRITAKTLLWSLGLAVVLCPIAIGCYNSPNTCLYWIVKEREAWHALSSAWGQKESDTTERLNNIFHSKSVSGYLTSTFQRTLRYGKRSRVMVTGWESDHHWDSALWKLFPTPVTTVTLPHPGTESLCCAFCLLFYPGGGLP